MTIKKRIRGYWNTTVNNDETIRLGACADNQLFKLVAKKWEPFRFCDKREAFDWKVLR